MVRINPIAVVKLLQSNLANWSTSSGLEFSSTSQPSDKAFASLLTAMVIGRYENKDSIEESLEIDENFEFDEDVESESDHEESDGPRTRASSFARKCSIDDNDGADPDYSPSPHKRSPGDVKITMAQKRAVVDYAWLQTSQRRKLSCIISKFCWIKNWRQIYDYREQVRQGGDREDIVKEIRAATFLKFQYAFNSGLAIHNLDIHFWAMEAAASLDYSFKASDSWVAHFKKLFGIRSRKITAHVSTVNYEKEPELEAATKAFQEKIRMLVINEKIDRGLVWNADQTGKRLLRDL
ncbi:hypothetical protein HDE_11622 [Halotydeus destructor]|nr:hypothetical protein HDE_11622 [Halotydeus destructor]